MPRSRRKKKHAWVSPGLSGDGFQSDCHWCGRRLIRSTWSGRGCTKDHVLPRSMGGTYMVWCCRACNNLKGDMMPDDWESFMEENPEWWEMWNDSEEKTRQSERIARQLTSYLWATGR